MNPILIQDYDPRWPGQFETLRSRVASALGALAAAIEHVGSTAVPGLAAKPIIDLDIVLASAADFPLVVERLASFGYVHEGDLGIAGREAFKDPPGPIPHHLYVCYPGSKPYWEHLAFRNHLRTHPEDSQAYGELKRRLALQFPNDREAYTQAKTEFIVTILHRALPSSARETCEVL